MTDEEVYCNRVRNRIASLNFAIETKDRVKIGARIFDLKDVLLVLKSIAKSSEATELIEMANSAIADAREPQNESPAFRR